MNEKLYAKKMVIVINGRDVEIPVVHNNPVYQQIYIDFRQALFPHAEAEYEAENASQTKLYDEFVMVVRHDGRFIKIPAAYSADPEVQERYKTLRQMGETHNGADLVITKAHPGLGLTDTSLLKYDLIHNQFSAKRDNVRGDIMAAEAKKLGISITGKFYHPGLASKFADPEAWVGSIDDIRQVCKRRGHDFSIQEGIMKIGIKADMSKTLEQQFAAKPPKVGA